MYCDRCVCKLQHIILTVVFLQSQSDHTLVIYSTELWEIRAETSRTERHEWE